MQKIYKIKNVLLCGLGGLGCICAAAIKNSSAANLKILVDKERYERYTKTYTCFNSKPYFFEYITPEDDSYKADLVIIATKNDGLDFAINNAEKFVHKDTIYISLLNGIHSEKKLSDKYGNRNIVTAFYLGHSCIRNERNIFQDGIYQIVTGIENSIQEPALDAICTFFSKAGIKYKVSENILEEYWKKFMINVGINQLCAITNKTLKEIKEKPSLVQKLKDIIEEVEIIAEKEGIENHKQITQAALNFLLEEIEDAQPSMLQDIRAGRKTEVDIFAGEIIRLAEKYNVNVPFNIEIYKKIRELENKRIYI